jgi:CBS domain-containing protein
VNGVEGFLGTHPPFDHLSPADLADVASSVQVEFFPAGAVILHRLGTPAEFVYVVRTGAVRLVDDGRVVDVLEEGELFGHPSLLTGRSPTMTVQAEEDTLSYLVPRTLAERAFGTPSGLAFLAASLSRRLERARRAREGLGGDPRMVRAGSLVARPPLVCEPTTTIRAAAELMAAERASSILVRTETDFGIVTDRDLRTKVLADGMSPDRPVSEIMSSPVRSVGADRLVHEVLLEMIEGGIHHLPVVEEGGRVVGVITDTDILGLERRRPFTIRAEVERAGSPEEVAAVTRTLPTAVATLARAGLDPVEVGHIVAVTLDAVARRLIHLAMADLGEPPAPWAWIALGSEARREQALGTDQDHALAYEDGAEQHDGYFGAVAERVVSGLVAGGLPRCRAGILASERPWRRTASGWVRVFVDWMTTGSGAPRGFAHIGFDYRVIDGPLDIEPRLDEVIRSGADLPAFVHRLARAALDSTPPIGFRGALVVHRKGERAGTLDVKRGGLTAIVDLARLFSVQARSTAKATLERLAAAEASGVLAAETRRALDEAFRVVLEARLSHQMAQVETGMQPDNALDPSTLGRIDRTRLKDALRVISEVQRDVGRAHPMRRLGP